MIRKPTLKEVSSIKKLLDLSAREGRVLARPIVELYETARDFFVFMKDDDVAGCCALHIDLEDLAEIRSLVVREDLRGIGVGRQLVETCLDDARRLDIARVYALTRSQEFFTKLGFREVDKHELPHKVFNDCVRCPLFPDCDESAMVYDLRTYTQPQYPARPKPKEDTI